jgi:Transposase DDE domain group 1
VHARVEDVIRTGKDTGLGHFPSHDYKVNQAWLDAAMTGCILLAWLKLIALDGDLARAEPKTLRYRLLHAAARLVRGGRRRTLKIAANWPGPRSSSPPGNASAPSRTQSDQQKPVPPSKKGVPGPAESPATRPDSRATRHAPPVKSGTRNPPDDRQRQPSDPPEKSGLVTAVVDRYPGSSSA